MKNLLSAAFLAGWVVPAAAQIPPLTLYPTTADVILGTPCGSTGTPLWRSICSSDMTAVFATANNWTTLQTFSGGLSAQLPWVQPSNVALDPNRAVINSFPLTSEFGANTSSVVQALVGAVDVPSTATGTLMSGVSGYSRTASTASDAVGIFGEGEANAANVSVWGGNVVASNAPGFGLNDGTGFDLTSLIGLEIDTAVSKKTGNVLPNVPTIGLWITGSATAQSTNTTFDALDIGFAGASTSTPWKDAIRIRSGASNAAAIEIDQAAAGNSQPSQNLTFVSMDSGGAGHIQTIYSPSTNGLYLAPDAAGCAVITAGVGGGTEFWSCPTQVRAFVPFLTAQILDQSAVPTVSSCGTSPSVNAGSANSSGQFTTGTGTPAACTVTFSTAWPNNAFCTVSPANAAAAAITGGYYISASSRTAFTVTLGTGTSSAAFNYSCSGH